ncbi:AmmeMemoRadiSam system protein B [Parendozoicomonas haliclonae]|uniref:MEMO1 family protein EHSB41UT_03791 n=1 Tax=Parendozoicomonas haliclonae TaxID=1960125 RepID=A0A1X7APH5_9GAMM|nr:AmmeMemoRadiSam system protein B [Parendozoicomonas haliclonae]SMA50000.1 hypothetical protein EHSB41UT_03791 [Parendozoicomonas haliclonae]
MTIRQPAVAGAFYPANRSALTNELSEYLNQTNPVAGLVPKVLVVPHAGYIYSGATAAAGYRQLTALRDTIKRVIVLGPSHRVPLQGLALPESDVFLTPLGSLEIDQNAKTQLSTLSQVHSSEAAHELEHSLEVQLPFLQTTLDDFTLVPLVVGEASPLAVAEVLESLWGGEETLIVISTDLSHFLNYENAVSKDHTTIHHIEQMQPVLDGEQACGCRPLNGLLRLAKEKGMSLHTLAYCNSGDTAGDKNRVVGYASFALQ